MPSETGPKSKVLVLGGESTIGVATARLLNSRGFDTIVGVSDGDAEVSSAYGSDADVVSVDLSCQRSILAAVNRMSDVSVIVIHTERIGTTDVLRLTRRVLSRSAAPGDVLIVTVSPVPADTRGAESAGSAVHRAIERLVHTEFNPVSILLTDIEYRCTPAGNATEPKGITSGAGPADIAEVVVFAISRPRGLTLAHLTVG